MKKTSNKIILLFVIVLLGVFSNISPVFASDKGELLKRAKEAIEIAGETAKNSLEVKVSNATMGGSVFVDIVFKEAGIACIAGLDDKIEIKVYEEENGKATDIACNLISPLGISTYYAYKRPGSSIQAELDMAAMSIKMMRGDNLVEMPPPLEMEISTNGGKFSDFKIFEGTLAKAFVNNQEDYITSVFIGQKDNWFIKLRETSSLAMPKRGIYTWFAIWKVARPDVYENDKERMRQSVQKPTN